MKKLEKNVTSGFTADMERPQKKLFFLRHFLSLFAFVVLLVFLGIFSFDKPIAQMMSSCVVLPKVFCESVKFLFNPPKSYVFWPLAYFFMAVWTRKTRLTNFMLAATVAVPLANLITNALKILLTRARPELLLSANEYGFFFFKNDFLYQSFPSGHATTIGAIAGVLTYFFPKKTALIAVVAFVLSFCRVATNLHFLSDILAGLFIGLVCAQWVSSKLFTRQL